MAAFAEEWEGSLHELRRELPLFRRFEAAMLAWQKENWSFACALLEESDASEARRMLFRHLLNDPASILFRPVAGAIRRVLFTR